MLPSIEQLLTLQDRDQKLRAVLNEIAALPAEKAARDRELKAADERLEAARARQKEIEVERKKLEVEVKAKQDQIARYKNQQLETRKNEEFAALRHEIEMAEKVVVGLEDRELVLMEEAESLKPALQEAQEAHAAEKKKVESHMASLTTRKENLEARKAELETERPRFTEGIDEDLLDRYNRLFKSKNGIALVTVEHEVCTGCHMKVTHQAILEVKAEKEIIGCPQCGRILYEPQ
jgi:predicted  nucleic acid-binding Zn-ribbon protein